MWVIRDNTGWAWNRCSSEVDAKSYADFLDDMYPSMTFSVEPEEEFIDGGGI